jgi:hypothetical protein
VGAEYRRRKMAEFNKKKLQKLQKKCQKGELNMIENYYECVKNGIQGKASFQVKLDPSRANCNHNLNLSVTRNFIPVSHSGYVVNDRYDA